MLLINNIRLEKMVLTISTDNIITKLQAKHELEMIPNGASIKWLNIVDAIKGSGLYTTTEVPVSTADLYRGDMFGLFKYLKIPEQFILPHILINGFKHSLEYTGKETKIVIIDTSILNRYIPWVHL